jgi:hypothetical protein
MRDLILLFVHVLTTLVRVSRPGGVRSVIAESVLLNQLLILNRSRHRAPNLRALDRLIAGFCSLWITPNRLLRSAIALKPSTLLNFHRALVYRKYRLLFSPKHRVKPGPKGPHPDLIRAVVEMKQRNPMWGCPRIAEQIAHLLSFIRIVPTNTKLSKTWPLLQARATWDSTQQSTASMWRRPLSRHLQPQRAVHRRAVAAARAAFQVRSNC